VKSFFIYGFNNGGTITCDVLASRDNMGRVGQKRFTGSDTSNGFMLLAIGTDTTASPNPSYFYTVRCTLPPQTGSTALIIGVHPFNGGTLLTPASVDGFSSSTGGVDTSAGYYGGGTTGFVVDGRLGAGGTLSCQVYAWDTAGRLYAFGNSASSTNPQGYVSLNTLASVPGSADYFYTVQCNQPAGFELRGFWPGH
jgi:hypothetical protein